MGVSHLMWVRMYVWGKKRTFYWFLFSFFLKCVFKRKRKMNSPTNRNNPTNNKRFSSKVPRADWVSILNLKTRLSQCKLLFTIDIFTRVYFVVGSVIVRNIDIFLFVRIKYWSPIVIFNFERAMFDWCAKCNRKP